MQSSPEAAATTDSLRFSYGSLALEAKELGNRSIQKICRSMLHMHTHEKESVAMDSKGMIRKSFDVTHLNKVYM